MIDLYSWLKNLLFLTLALILVVLVRISFPGVFQNWEIHWPKNPDEKAFVENIQLEEHLLEEGPGKDKVVKHCLGCHSAKLIVQNRMNGERWKYTIDWMQETQGLWDLGTDERIVIDYLATHYAPVAVGRRQNLNIQEVSWYLLEEDEKK